MHKYILILLSISSIAGAQVPTEIKKEIDLRIEHQINPSIVVGVYHLGQSHFYTQGLQNKEKNMPATENSVYEIGSISKTFTALLLAQKAQANQLQLDDAVQVHWPEPFQLVDSDQQAITLKQLATHTSGLPRLPSNMSPFAKDPYADYDRSNLLEGIDKAKPGKAGINYAYSNFAAGLLGETMAVIGDRTYNDLVKTDILQPLKLYQTFMQLDEVPKSLLAQGYMGNKPSNAWRFKALAGAGSIRSSVKDLLAYGVAYLNQPPGPMREAMDLATQIHYQQDRLRVGLGWHINAKGIIWHNGETAGFSSMVMIDPKQQKVVAGITNNNTNIEDIVLHLMDASHAMKTHDYPLTIKADQLAQFTGTFKPPEADKNIRIQHVKDRLIFNAPMQPKYAMTYIGDDTFKLNLAKVKLHFNRNDQDQVINLELQGWGKAQRYEKVFEN